MNKQGHLLIVEDEEVFARALRKHLEKKGYTCTVCGHIAEVETAMVQNWPQLMLCDIRLPDGSGLDLIEKLAAAATPAPPTIVMSAYGDMDDAIQSLRAGVGDYLKKPFDLEELDLRMDRVLQQARLQRKLDYSTARARDPEKAKDSSNTTGIIGNSAATRSICEQLNQIADIACQSETPPTVLLTGETGTGKGLAARMLHSASKRANQPFVQIDCASLPADIIEAELFGHSKGAFTDAHTSRTGLIEAAEEGVVFLDEIGELPLTLQTKLLAVLDRRVLRRVGTSTEIPIHAWFIAASNRNLEAMVSGPDVTFRPDLYYRLNVLCLKLPALRERQDDALVLARHFATAACRRYGFEPIFAANAESAIKAWHWPGNIRELSHAIERAVLLGKGVISPKNLPRNDELQDTAGSSGIATARDAKNMKLPAPATIAKGDEQGNAEKRHILQALEKHGGDIAKTAKELGMERSSLRYRIRKYGISTGKKAG